MRVAEPLLSCCACEPAPAPGRATGCAAAGCGLPSRACKREREQAAGADRGAHSDGPRPLGGRTVARRYAQNTELKALPAEKLAELAATDELELLYLHLCHSSSLKHRGC